MRFLKTYGSLQNELLAGRGLTVGADYLGAIVKNKNDRLIALKSICEDELFNRLRLVADTLDRHSEVLLW